MIHTASMMQGKNFQAMLTWHDAVPDKCHLAVIVHAS
jgi:hypothetical protein